MILVIGQPRTGTSLAMQMLAAAGAQCTGYAPAYEDPRFLAPPFEFGQFDDRTAAKMVWCSEHNNVMIPRNAICIVTSRDTRQQLLSEWKFVNMVGFGLPLVPPLVRNRRRLMEKASAEYEKQIAKATRIQTRVDVPFEIMIQEPQQAAAAIAATIGFGDVDRMAACVRKRSPNNYPGFLENELLAEIQQNALRKENESESDQPGDVPGE